MDKIDNSVYVGVYIRVSTDKQELDNQIMALKPFCQKKGWDIVNIYTDVTSGTKDKRPGLDLLFEDAHKLKFNMVLFWSLDRFSRSGTIFTIQKLKELDNLNISWHSYQEPWISTVGPWKDVVISILSTLAKMERDRISERTRAGLARAKARGITLGNTYRKYNFGKIWKEYRKQGSINRAAKILNYSFGTVQFIIKHDIHDQEAYIAKRKEFKKKKLSSKGCKDFDFVSPSEKVSTEGPSNDNGGKA